MYRTLALLLLFPTTLAAQDCANATTQADMTRCAGQELEGADRALNAAFAKAVAQVRAVDAGLPEGRKGAEDALRRAQRAWITYRDAGCEAEGYAYDGGSMQPMVVASCKARVTGQRTGALHALAAGPEGAMTGQ